MNARKIDCVLAVTGASGAAYAKTLIEHLYREGISIQCLVSRVGEKVWEWEIGRSISEMLPPEIAVYGEDDWWTPVASGSVKAGAMVIIPCSMGTLAAVAHGLARNIIHRAADVMLKEKRPLILVPRETPLNTIHLENMLRLARAGATVLPAMPGFYHRPEKIQDMVDFVVDRILDHLGIEKRLIKPWGDTFQ